MGGLGHHGSLLDSIEVYNDGDWKKWEYNLPYPVMMAASVSDCNYIYLIGGLV